jgi:hypothetical protein
MTAAVGACRNAWLHWGSRTCVLMPPPFDPEREIQRLHRDLASQEPAEFRRAYLARIEEGRLGCGSGRPSPRLGVIPAAQTASGLIVPASAVAGPAPIDAMSTYLTSAEVLGRPLTDAELDPLLKSATDEHFSMEAATWLALLEHHGSLDVEFQLEAAGKMFTEPARSRVQDLVRSGARLIAPQVLLAVIKAALLGSPAGTSARADDKGPNPFTLTTCCWSGRRPSARPNAARSGSSGATSTTTSRCQRPSWTPPSGSSRCCTPTTATSSCSARCFCRSASRAGPPTGPCTTTSSTRARRRSTGSGPSTTGSWTATPGESIQRIVPELPGGARRVWYEEDMQQAWSPKRGKVSVCDIAIDYGWAWVCIEVVSGRLTQKTLTGGTAADFDQDVAKLVEKKVKQLDATIQHLDRSTLQFRTDDLLGAWCPMGLSSRKGERLE